MWVTLLIISVALNAVSFMYIRWLLSRFRTLVEDLDSVGHLISEYVEHIKSVYELEMFYGDPTLEMLLKHGTELSEILEEVDYLLNPEDTMTPEEDSKDDLPG